MPEDKNVFQKFSALMEQNIRGVQYGIYSVAGLGLLIALRSVRPFAKFSRPSDIPSHFIARKMGFIGRVVRIEPSPSPDSNPLVMIDHRPLVSLLKKSKENKLPVEISSVNITGNGFLWMQSLLTNEEVTFVPLRTSSDRVYCVLSKKKQNVGEQLVKIGFATVSPIDVNLEKDEYYLKYYKILLSAEKKAEHKGVGVWAGNKVSIPRLLLNKLKGFMLFSV